MTTSLHPGTQWRDLRDVLVQVVLDGDRDRRNDMIRRIERTLAAIAADAPAGPPDPRIRRPGARIRAIGRVSTADAADVVTWRLRTLHSPEQVVRHLTRPDSPASLGPVDQVLAAELRDATMRNMPHLAG